MSMLRLQAFPRRIRPPSLHRHRMPDVNVQIHYRPIGSNVVEAAYKNLDTQQLGRSGPLKLPKYGKFYAL